MINYSNLPSHMQKGAREYVEYGTPPGGFLYAVLSNDFKEAFARADDTNTAHMRTWAHWVMWECPAIAQGSVGKVEAWIKIGGMNGYQNAKEHSEDSQELEKL